MLRPRRRFLVSNKWRRGNAHFDLSQLPNSILQAEGIIPVPAVLDPRIGSEVTLLVIDPTPFIYELAEVKPFNLVLKSGLLNTSYGPVLFHLFIIPKPEQSGEAFAVHEAYANPFETQHAVLWRDLSRQSHWHLFLIDANAEQIQFFEFENCYSLDKTLAQVEQACRGMQQSDFMAAKREVFQRYAVEDLMAM